MKLSKSQKAYLKEATVRYHESLPGSLADEHLAERGLRGATVAGEVDKFRLGFVADPLPGHEMYRGMLSIPYLRRAHDGEWSVVSLRFRCLLDHDHHGHGKYNTEAGDTPRLFNTLALITSDDTIAITEGEIDAITAQVCGIPAVGVPGVQSWKPHFLDPFLGYERVYILSDGDDPGRQFARAVAQQLPNAKIIPSPEGMDVNKIIVTHGPSAIKELLV